MGKRYDQKLVEIFKGGSIAFVGTLLGYGLNYLYKLISGRYLGPSDFGLLAIGISIMTVVGNISVIGLNEGITRFIPYYKTKGDYGSIKSMLAFGIQISLTIGGIFALLVFLYAEWISIHIFNNTQSIVFIKLCSLCIPLQALYLFLTGVIRGLKKIATIAIARSVFWWGINILNAIVIIFFGLSYVYYAMGFLIAMLAIILYYFNEFKRHPIRWKLQNVVIKKEAKKEIFIYSLPLTIANFFYLLRDRTDILIIAAFLSSKDAGLYYAACPFAMILTIVLYSINRILNPIISEAVAKGDIDETSQIFKDISVRTFQITLPAFLIVFFFAEQIIVLAYGQKYLGAVIPLKILSVGYFFNAIMGPFGECFRAFGITKLVFLISALGGMGNAFLMFILIPKYGINGASIAALLSLCLMVCTGVFFNHTLLNINPFNLLYFKTMCIGISYFVIFLIFEKYVTFSFFLVFFVFMLVVYLIWLIYIMKIFDFKWRGING